MATYPPPPPPTQPPLPPRTNNNNAVLAVVTGVVILACLFVGFGIYVVRTVVMNTHIDETGAGDQHNVEIHSPLGDLKVHGKGDQAKVDIHSPFGDVKVNPTPDIADLGMEVYPGAELVQSRADSPFDRWGHSREDGIDALDGVDFDPGNSPGAQVQLRHGDAVLDVDVAEFRTSATPEQVLEYYDNQLGRYGALERRNHGRTNSVELKLSNSNVRTAAVKPGSDGTHFILVRVRGDSGN